MDSTEILGGVTVQVGLYPGRAQAELGGQSIHLLEA
jgi:hypothetical protein